jgi:hypothetical protein
MNPVVELTTALFLIGVVVIGLGPAITGAPIASSALATAASLALGIVVLALIQRTTGRRAPLNHTEATGAAKHAPKWFWAAGVGLYLVGLLLAVVLPRLVSDSWLGALGVLAGAVVPGLIGTVLIFLRIRVLLKVMLK